MEIKELNNKVISDSNKKLIVAFDQFDRLLSELRKRELPEDIVATINRNIEEVNDVIELEKKLRKQIRKSQADIIRLLEKQLKLVPINYYRNTWLALGMAAFGVPLGVAFGSIIGNMSFIGFGIPIGIMIGMAVGARMDKKAVEEERQLDIELKN